jgi:hypothetical protein
MTMKFKCYTLFDITKTNITNRKAPSDLSVEQAGVWQSKRNMQCNFDTIIQLISLRAQPEDITDPVKHNSKADPFDKFGSFLSTTPFDYWTFTFTVNHAGVFNDGTNELGFLYSDCDLVPMIKIDQAHSKTSPFLEVNPALGNIYFEMTNDE